MNIPMEKKNLYIENKNRRKLPLRRSWLKINFEMKITILNQRMVFEGVNMTTKIVPPLEEPEGEVCSNMPLWK
jgi:hypothetical protein